ncbi:MAG: hypothetical protein M3Q69_06235 [Acidobacteriota bacterium]|nr:hypothetical protein [Acidobacteriota bacterium]
MKTLLPLALVLFLAACKNDPGPGQLTGTSTPEAMGERQTHTAPQNDTALTGTFGGNVPGQSGQSAVTATHPGATGTDVTSGTDPNVTTAAPTVTGT